MLGDTLHSVVVTRLTAELLDWVADAKDQLSLSFLERVVKDRKPITAQDIGYIQGAADMLNLIGKIAVREVVSRAEKHNT